jgi:hypothetical protein
MRRYRTYVSKLERLVARAAADAPRDDWRKEVTAALDGQPTQELFSLVEEEKIRAAGAYFTGSGLSARVARMAAGELRSGAVVCDPTCGVGDLLLACLKHLADGGLSPEILGRVAQQLRGHDIHEEFVQTTRLRLSLALLSRGEFGSSRPAAPRALLSRLATGGLFAGIRVADSLSDFSFAEAADCLTLNPPFTPMVAPPDCRWGSGRVSGAAVMTDGWLRAARAGTRVFAILPDVLRSGSFYERWRREVASLATVESARVVGCFGPHADVDVFLLSLTRRKRVKTSCAEQLWSWPSPTHHAQKLGDLFEIHVGSIVPTRDKPRGDWQFYLQASDLPPWAVIKPTAKRRYAGKVYRPPFVLIRRTSRSDDRMRAVATLVRGEGTVAIENHLIVLLPKDGRLKTCAKLLDSLKHENTTKWLNERIRCRHLTVSALSQLPLFASSFSAPTELSVPG